ncbi:MAG: molybdopterin converting factor subunit 1 [Chloroflexi bacterium]|nr:molybdopterin converting factor subunit 1 [Chloroflexota bacterium]
MGGIRVLDITVLYFAAYREQSGKTTEKFSLTEASILSDLIDTVLKSHPQIKCSKDRMVAAVNEEYQLHNYPLKNGDMVALIPPVSGGQINQE